MQTLERTLNLLKIPILEDGKISLGETSVILRQIMPFAVRGDGAACELRDLLVRVRNDGVITREESNRVIRLMNQITEGSVQLDRYLYVTPDYPREGFSFVDVSRLFDTPWLFKMVLDMIGDKTSDIGFDLVVSPAPRGIGFGAAVAAKRGVGFVPVYEKGGLSRGSLVETVDGVFGSRTLAMYNDAVTRGERVLIVDDLLATGNTAAAVARMVESLGGKVVRMVFPVEIQTLKAREGAVKGREVVSLVKLETK